MNRIDRTIEWLDPGDLPTVLRLLSVMEEFGQIRGDEAAEWRRRIGGWAHFFEIHRDAQPSD